MDERAREMRERIPSSTTGAGRRTLEMVIKVVAPEFDRIDRRFDRLEQRIDSIGDQVAAIAAHLGVKRNGTS